jgi:putative transposase
MDDREDHALLVASFRYRIIAEAAEAQGEGVTAAVKEAAAAVWTTPWGAHGHFSQRQIWRWVAAYAKGGLSALRPKRRVDAGTLRAVPPAVMEAAASLRRENPNRPTKTIIDVLVRQKVVTRGELKRSTVDRRLATLGLSRRALRTLGRKVFKKIETHAPLELVIADFHHGPYVREPGEERARRALLLVFIDHFSRYVLEGRYYLHEDFAALRFGFRRVLLVYGVFGKLYVDNGPSFHAGRFHAACKNKEIDIWLVHSKAYESECRGAVERFNRTVKEQFEDEVRQREELCTLDELNTYFEAWLAERYHRDIHSETGETPFDRWRDNVMLRQAPNLERLDELLRLRKRAKVHPKWSTVECQGVRYLADPGLRGRKVHVLYDAMDKSYILIELDSRVVQRAEPQRPGHSPAQPEPPPVPKEKTDYLQLLRDGYQQRVKSELAALDLRPAAHKKELCFVDFAALMQTCRATDLADFETAQLQTSFRKLRPIEPEMARQAIDVMRRRLGLGLHISIYLDALQTTLVQQRAKKGTRS